MASAEVEEFLKLLREELQAARGESKVSRSNQLTLIGKIDDLVKAVGALALDQGKHGQEIDDLTREVSRLVTELQREDDNNARLHRLEQEDWDRRIAKVHGDVIEVRDRMGEQPERRPQTKEELLMQARALVDEVRQGLLLRAAGVAPERVDPERAASDKSDGGAHGHDSISFVIKKDGRVITMLPKLPWKHIWLALKAAALVGGGALLKWLHQLWVAK